MRGEVVSGGIGKRGGKERKPGITPIERWEGDFENTPYFNDIEKILELPGTDDMAGILARGNFKNDRQRVAAVRLAYKNRKFKDDNHQQMLRDYIASSLGTKALGKILQLQTGTNLLAPAVLREVLSMKQNKQEEEVRRGSDFREEGRNQPVGNNQ